MKLSLCTDKSHWNFFVSTSPQGNVFCQTPFIDSIGAGYELWWVEEGGNPRLGAIVLKDEVGQPLKAPFGFSLYQGLLFSQEHANVPVHSRVKKTLEIVEFFLIELKRYYNKISFCLHPRFEDLRSFSWFHYHEPQLGQFKLDIYYTGLIDLTSSPDFETYLTTIRGTRRYEYRRALREGLTIENSHDLDTLDNLYRLTFKRQEIELDPLVFQRMHSVAMAALSQKFGKLMVCRSKTGVAISATLFLYDERCGYYLIGANHPDYRNSWSGTFLFLENVRLCQAHGLKWVDVCGINSPNRGDFKSSFNAIPIPYFVVNWKCPSY